MVDLALHVTGYDLGTERLSAAERSGGLYLDHSESVRAYKGFDLLKAGQHVLARELAAGSKINGADTLVHQELAYEKAQLLRELAATVCFMTYKNASTA